MKIKLNLNSTTAFTQSKVIDNTSVVTLQPSHSEKPKHLSQSSLSIELLKKYNKGFGRMTTVLLILCIISGIFFLSSSVTLFAQSRVAIKEDTIQICTNSLAEAESLGLEYEAGICNFASYDYLWNNNFEYHTIDSIERDIVSQTKYLDTSIIQSLNILTEITEQLNKLEIEGFVDTNRIEGETLYQHSLRLETIIVTQTALLETSIKLLPLLFEDISSAFEEYTSEKDKVNQKYLKTLSTFLELIEEDNTVAAIDVYIETREALILFYEEVAKAKVDKVSRPNANFLIPVPTNISQFKIFSPQEFVALGDAVVFSNVSAPDTVVPITGNDIADAHIRTLAENRGYKRRPEALGNLTTVDGYALQPEAARAWLELKSASTKEGFPIGLVSGFRSTTSQQQIFMNRLRAAVGAPFDIENIASGMYDSQIQSVLNFSSIPGYSKHHTGFVIDVNDIKTGAFTTFASSGGYAWLSANNYYNAKRFGFIPSYPLNGGPYGPQPEAWEYVYVGVAALR